MNNKDFSTSLVLDATPQQVFDAINNVRGWWSENIEGATDEPDSTFNYHYQDVHRATIRVDEMIPGKRITWQVLDNYFKFTKDTTEWKGTRIIFAITEAEGKTQLRFTHEGLVPEYECFQLCRDAWTHYIHDSLKNLILTGKGSPTPKETEATVSEEENIAIEASGKSICHRLLIEAPIEKVYLALTTQKGLAAWWTPETLASPETGTIARFAFGPDYFKEMKIEELVPYSKVKWSCITGAEEWLGTTLTFALAPHRKGSILFFRHEGWKDYTAEFASCSFDWALFFRSLKMLCETGTGMPYPDFNKQ